MPLFMGVCRLGDKAMMLLTGESEHRPFATATTRESSDRSLSYRAYAITTHNRPLDIALADASRLLHLIQATARRHVSTSDLPKPVLLQCDAGFRLAE